MNELRRFLRGDGLTEPRFVAFRCDKPGLEGLPVWQTSYVATVAPHRAVVSDMSPRSLARYFGSLERLDERHAAGKIVVEHVFETVRSKVDARLPSRLNCIYVCQNLEVAALWNGLLPGTVTYACQIVGWWAHVDANKFGEARVLLDPPNPTPETLMSALQEIERIAEAYWNHDMGDPYLPELLIDGSAQLICRANPAAQPSVDRWAG